MVSKKAAWKRKNIVIEAEKTGSLNYSVHSMNKEKNLILKRNVA